MKIHCWLTLRKHQWRPPKEGEGMRIAPPIYLLMNRICGRCHRKESYNVVHSVWEKAPLTNLSKEKTNA